MSRDELWSKHLLTRDVKTQSREALYSKSIEELEDVTSIQNECVGDIFSNDEMSAEEKAEEKTEEKAEEKDEIEVLLAAMKNSDDVALPESGVYFDALEARIMGALDSAIEHGEVEDRDPKQTNPVQEIDPVAARGAMTRASSRRVRAIRAGQMVMFVGVAIVMTGKLLIAPSPARPTLAKTEHSVELAGSSELRAIRAAAPKVLASTVMSFEIGDDLALDIEARKIAARHAKN